MAEFFLLQEDGFRLEQDDNHLDELLLEDGGELDHEGYDFLLLDHATAQVTQMVVMVLIGPANPATVQVFTNLTFRPL